MKTPAAVYFTCMILFVFFVYFVVKYSPPPGVTWPPVKVKIRVRPFHPIPSGVHRLA